MQEVIDHIINSVAKSNYLSAGQISVPFFFRGPNGALAGPTFSVMSVNSNTACCVSLSGSWSSSKLG
ncbi:hypothetical protein P3S67_027393 [Capsicum chacoense]